MQPKILLVNPPIYDFSAYDFWLKPYGLLRVAGYLRGQAQLSLFDYLDRFHPLAPSHPAQRPGTWERGPFYAENVPKPVQFTAIHVRTGAMDCHGHSFKPCWPRQVPSMWP